MQDVVLQEVAEVDLSAEAHLEELQEDEVVLQEVVAHLEEEAEGFQVEEEHLEAAASVDEDVVEDEVMVENARRSIAYYGVWQIPKGGSEMFEDSA